MNWIKAHKVWSVVIAIVILFIIAGASGGNKKKQENVAPTPVTKTTSQQAKVEQKPQYVFDTPSLIGMNIDQVRTTLGTPKDGAQTEPTAQQKQLGTDQWDNTFDKNNVSLLVTFNPNTRTVIDYFLAYDSQDVTKDQQQGLLTKGNLTTSNSKYKVEFVKELKDPNKYTGVKVTPQQ